MKKQYPSTVLMSLLCIAIIAVQSFSASAQADWNYGCGENMTVELEYVGINNSVPASLSFSNPGNIDHVVAEIVYKGCNPGSSITIQDASNNSYTAYRVQPSGASSNVWVYRTTINATSSISYSNQSNESCAQSLVAYVFRNQTDAGQTSGTFTGKSGYNNVTTVNVPIPTDAAVRDLTLYIPMSEMTTDGRYIHLSATAGGVTSSVTERIYSSSLPNGCCIKLFELQLNNVPANANTVTLTIDTRHNVHTNANGQSWVLAAAVYTNIECAQPCANGTGWLTADVFGQTNCNGQKSWSNPYKVEHSDNYHSWVENLSTSYPLSKCLNITDFDANLSATDIIKGIEVSIERKSHCNDAITDEVVQLVLNGQVVGQNKAKPGFWTTSDVEITYGGSTDTWGANLTAADVMDGDFGVRVQVRGNKSSSCTAKIDQVKVSICYEDGCDNVTNAGQIGVAQSGCSPFDPAMITSLSDPSGGSGALEYVWLKSTNGGSSYTVISGANSSTYNPGSITETTWYRRCARRAGCSSYVGESNWVQMTVTGPCCDNVTNAGVIGLAQSGCTPFDPNPITSISDPSGGSGSLEYVWLQSTNGGSSYTVIAGANGSSYDPGALTTTTWFRRCARRAGCTSYVGESNWVQITVTGPCCDNVTDAGEIGYEQTGCAPFDPAELVSIEDPSGGTGALEFVWLVSTNGGGSYSVISGANGLTYDPGSITQTTWYRRCARRAGCTSYVGESNWVMITVGTTGVTVNVSKTDVTCESNNSNECEVVHYQNGSHAVWLNGMTGGVNYKFEGGHGTLVENEDGTGHFSGIIYNTSDNDKRWQVEINLEDKKTWAQWSAMGGDWKGDAGTVGNNYQDWGYYSFGANSRMIGLGDWAGQELAITQNSNAPQYRVQVGIAANDKNGNYGLSAWFDYAGDHNGHGDFNFDIQNCVEHGCDGTAMASASGGTAPYTYVWDNGMTTSSIDGLCAGQYCVSVIDANGCESDDVCVTIGDKPSCCNVTNPGEISGGGSGCAPYDPTLIESVSAPSGGSGDLEIVWITREGTSGPWIMIPGADGISYNPGPITTTTQFRRCARRSGCADYIGESNIITITVTGPCCDNVTNPGSIAENQTNCGPFDVAELTSVSSPSGGSGDLEIVWITREGTSGPWQMIAGADGLSYDPGVVSVTTQYRRCARRAGCEDYVGESNIITITIVPGIEVNCSSENGNCANGNAGSASVSVSGGEAPYSYVWSNGATTASISGLAAGTYSVTVTDANGCEDNCSVTVTNTPCCNVTSGGEIAGAQENCGPFNPAPLTSVSLPTGGLGNLEYVWLSNPNNVPINNGNNGWVEIPNSNSATYDPGMLTETTCFIRCARRDGCTIYPGESNVICITINEEPVATCTSVNGNCSNNNEASASVSVSGGEAPYSYVWSNGATTASISGLAAGSYSVTVTDANGCTANCSVSVTITPCCNVTNGGTIAGVQENCGPFDPAAITNVTLPSGGLGDLEYVWLWNSQNVPLNNGQNGWVEIPNSNSATYDPGMLTASRCFIRCARRSGCTDYPGESNVICITVNPDDMVATCTPTDADCNGAATGSASVSTTGGTAPYTFLWSTGATTVSISNLTAGSYSVTVTDANGCTTTCSTVVGEPADLTASCTKVDGTCANNNVASVSVSAAGGTSPYTYLWSNGATTATISGLAAGTYSVTVTDANGCTETCSKAVTITPCCNVTDGGTIAGVQENCGPFDPDRITNAALPTGGLGDLEYVWLWNSQNVPLNNGQNGWVEIPNSNSETYDPGYLTESRCFIRCARNVGCTTYIGESNVICITVNPEPVATCTPTNGDCNNSNEASASVSVSGGTAPFSYAWSNGATTASISGLAAGTYSVTVTDANGCTDDCSVTVSVTPCCNATDPGTVAGSQENCGPFDPAAFTSIAPATGGLGAIEYQWYSKETETAWMPIAGATGETYDAGLISVHTQFKRCAKRENCPEFEECSNVLEITIHPDNIIATCNQNPAACAGSSTGSASVSAQGGTGPYTYVWSNGATTASISGLAAGTYSVTVTDQNGCMGDCSVVVTQVNSLVANCTKVDGNCANSNVASASVSATGGTAPFTYAWSNGATTASISGLAAGSYSVTVTDANGCTADCSVTVSVTPCCNVTDGGDIAGVQENCGPFDPDRITSSSPATGGIGPVEYLWLWNANNVPMNNGQNGWVEIPNSNSETYDPGYLTESRCFIRCARNVGCTTYIGESNVICITVNPEPVATCTPTNGDCNNSNEASASVSVSGGTAPFSYAWSNGATTASISGLAAGTYSVTVTDANGCTDDCSVTVSVTPCCNATDPGTVAGSQENCGPFDPATFTSINPATGGLGTIEYQWYEKETETSWMPIPGATSATYNAGMTSANKQFKRCAKRSGCSEYDVCSNVLEITIHPDNINPTCSMTPAACNGASTGTASVAVQGGTSPYTYAWSNGGTTATISGLSAGTYSVTVTDVNGCDNTCSVTVTEASALVADCSSTNGTCNNNNQASASVNVTGGTAPYTYEWNNGATTASISGLAAGTYSVTVTDANGCTADCSVTVSVTPCCNVTDGGDIAGAQENCGPFDPAAFTSVSLPTGGLGDLEYVWMTNSQNVPINNGNNGWVEIPNSNSATYDPGMITETTCFIRCARREGCIIYPGESNVICVTINESPVATCTPVNGDCSNNNQASASVNVTGGTAPYTYEWNNGAITASISGLVAGTYSVTVTDANGCTADCSVTVSVTPCCNVTDGGDIAGAQENCGPFDPAAFTSVSLPTGGLGDLEYVWMTNSQNVPINNGNNGWVEIPNSNSATYDPGMITETTCFIRCARRDGCTIYPGESNVICVTINESPVATCTPVNGDCSNNNEASASVSATGGTAPYSYAWSNGATTATISGLAEGTYLVTVTDANGCTDDCSVTVSVTPCCNVTDPGEIAADQEECGGFDPARITSVSLPSGGLGNVEYVWLVRNIGGTWSEIPNSDSPEYDPPYTNESKQYRRCARRSGCTTYIGESNIITITVNPDDVVATCSSTPVDCNGASSGSASVSPSGGTAPYTVLWSTGATTLVVNNLMAGSYSVTVTDANGCSETCTAEVEEPVDLTADCSSQNGTCSNNNEASASVSAAGGTAPYSYAWSNGATTASISGLAAGTYSVTVTDANGCTADCSVTVSVTPCCNVIDGGDIAGAQENCGPFDPEAFTSVSLPTGGLGDLEYVWMTNSQNVPINNGNNGWVEIPNSNSATYDPGMITETTCFIRCARREGCIIYPGESNVICVTINESPVATCTPVNGDCSNNNQASASVNVTGGTAPYTYEWNNGATTASISGLVAGTYSVTVTDANGCTADCSVTVSVTPCCNVTDGGEIAGAQENCGPFDPEAFTSVSLPTGGLGDLEYVWMTNSQNVPINNGNNGWVEIPNSNSATYDPGMITETTCFIRCARREGCIIYPGESNVICVTINESPVATCTPVNGDCSNNNEASASVSATGGTAPYTYLWSNGATTAAISGLAAGIYSVTVTDVNGCSDDCSVTVSVTPCCDVTDPGTVAGSQEGCGPFDPVAFTSVAPASGGLGGIVYQWYQKETETSWAPIPGATDETYDAGLISINTQFKRCARREGCPEFTFCSDILEIEIRPVPQVNCTSVSGNCSNGNGASASVNVQGGTAPYSYAWSNGGTTQTISNLAEGNYSVTVTDYFGCTADCNVDVTVEGCCNVTNGGQIAGVQENCGPFDPAAFTSVAPATGGIGPVEYIWLWNANNVPVNNGQNGWVEIPGSNSETYDPGYVTESRCFIRCARNVGCTNYIGESNVICITVNPIPVADCTSTNGDCSNDNQASASVNVTGGTAPYTYLWSTGATTVSISNLTAGSYSVTVTDVNGCTAVCSTAVSITPCCDVAEPGTVAGSQEGCGPFDPERFTSIAPATGGLGDVVYQWYQKETETSWAPIPGATDETYDAGLISINTQFKRCARREGCAEFEVCSDILEIEIRPVPNATCTKVDGNCSNGNLGSASVSVQGGTAPYTYEWSNGATTASISGLDAGTYDVEVTDYFGCTSDCSVTISIIPCCNVTDGGEIAGAQENCGPFDPEAFTSVSIPTGGLGDLEYVWMTNSQNVPINNGNNGWVEIPNSNSATYDPGMITETTCFIRCARREGCTVYVGESNVVCMVVNESPVATCSSTDSGCNGTGTGTATVSATGGEAPYTYAWSNGGTTATITGLMAGTYSVTVTDANGCTDDCTATVGEPSGLAADCNSTDASCNGVADGSIGVNATGGSAPYTYAWSNGATTASLTGVAAGTYSVTVTDANGCTATCQTTVSEPTALTADCSSVDGTCNNNNEASASVSVSGGDAPYSYAWSNGATTSSIDGLAAGTYSVTVTDANGCTADCSVTVSVTPCCNVTDGGEIAASQENCGPFDPGAITSLSLPSGGLGNLGYVWLSNSQNVPLNNGQNGWVEIPNSNSATYDPGILTETTCFIRCARREGCTVYVGESNLVCMTVNEAPVATCTPVNGDCNNGNVASASVSVAGGTAPYTVLWSTGVTTMTINNLEAGSYNVTVTDANGCEATCTAVVEITPCCNVTDGGEIAASQENCGPFDPAEITSVVDATGGLGDLEYVWLQNNENVPLNNGQNGWVEIPNSNSATYDPGMLTETTCFIRCARREGCTVYVGESNVVCITINEAPVATCTSVNGDCNNGNAASASVSVSGGEAPYSYAWSNGATTASIDNLTAGTYSVTVTDANGCEATCSTTVELTGCCNVTNPGEIGYDQENCGPFDVDELTDLITPTGGIGNLEIVWITRVGTTGPWQEIVGADGLTYDPGVISETTQFRRCVRRDGCTDFEETDIITITIFSQPEVVCNPTHGDCSNNGIGAVSTSIVGGTAPFTYAWSNGATTADISGLAAGNYSVVVTDANGCTSDCSVTITSEPCCNVTDGGEIAGVQENCGPFDPAAITGVVPATGGIGPVEYIWLWNTNNVPVNNGQNGWVEIPGSTSETYDPGMLTESRCFIRCARNVGCTTYIGESNVICITVNEVPVLTCEGVDGDCSNGNEASASVSVDGGEAPYAYAWSTSTGSAQANGATTASISGLDAGTYSVTVTDANGCEATCSTTVELTPCCNVTDGGEIAGAQENCGPFDPAAITSVVSATGGIGPVEYIWLWNANNVPVNNGQNGWVEIPGSTSETYDPGMLTESRCFIRCARNVGCTTYIGESNVICITVNEVPVATCTPVNGDCNNGNVASASVSVNDGTEPYDYDWSNGETTASISGLVAGSYSVTVTDANGCAATCTTTVELTPCCNVTDGGEIAADQSDCGPFDPAPFTSVAPATGGIGPVEYVWLSGECETPVNTWTEIPNSNSETYDAGMLTETTCFIRCARNVGCTDYIGESNIITITVGPGCCDNVTDGGEIAASQENCGPFSPGAFTSVVDPTGGSGDLEYVWLMNDENVPVNNGNNGWVEIPNSNSATYNPGMVTETTCYVRCARRAGCVPYIGESNVVCITINPADLAATCAPVNGDCGNQNEGSASVSVTGGEAPYTYEWSTSTGSAQASGATTASIDGLAAGSYTVTVTDANGCTATCDAVVEVEECCNVVDPGKIATEQENCGPFDVDELTDLITPTGGIGNLEIVWITRVGTTGPWQEIVGADGLTYDPGVISETTQFRRCVRREGCTSFEESNIITITILPAVEVECASISGDCGNGNLGSASVDVLSGIAPYSYEWNNGETTASIENLGAGTYNVTVTDENGCQATCTEEVIVTPCCNVTNPGEIAGNEESCSAFDPRPFTSVSPATGGIGPVEYRWLQGECGTPTIDWTVIPNSNSETIDVGMVSETTCLVRQARNSGCQPWIGESNIITITIQNTLTIECSSISGDCGNGNVASASVDVIDGTAPFTYEWSNGETTQTINNLAEGTYTVTVTDANGCSASCTEEVIVTPCCNVTNPGEIAANQENCGPFDPAPFTSVAPATGGIGPVEYMWLRGECGTPVEEWTEVPNANSETLDVDSVFETTCFIRCARNSSCEPWVGESNIITVTVYPAITLSCNGIDGDCANGNIAKAVAHISGGVEPYAVAWSNGEATATIDSLEAGTYTVVVTDANGCEATCDVTVEVTPCCNVTDGGEIAEDQENCGPFDPNAIVSVTPATGGIGSVEYAWYSGACSEVVSPTFAPTPQEAIPSGFTLIAGATGESYDPDTLTETTCFIRVARNEGCTDWIGESNIVTITIYDGPELACSAVDGNCENGNVGSASVTVSGAPLPLSYEWSNGATTASIQNLEAGTYSVVVTDGNGCVDSCSVDVEVIPCCNVTDGGEIAEDQENCGPFDPNAIVSVTPATGGLGPVEYAWYSGACSEVVSPTFAPTPQEAIPSGFTLIAGATGESYDPDTLTETTCFIRVARNEGCTDWIGESNIVTITIYDSPELACSAVDGNCENGNVGSASVTVSGAPLPLSYEWSNGATTASIQNLEAGTYSVVVTDGNGCVDSCSVDVEVIPCCNVTDGGEIAEDQENCGPFDPNAIGSVAPATGGIGPVEYAWYSGACSEVVSPTFAPTPQEAIPSGFTLIAGATGESYDPDTLTETTCFIRVARNEGCTDWVGESNIVTITIYEVPTVDVAITGGVNPTCSGSEVELTATSSTATSFEWSTGETTSSIMVTESGQYCATTVSGDGCEATACIDIIVNPTPDVEVEVTAGSNPLCPGNEVELTAVSQTAVGYEWSTSETTSSIIVEIAGTYIVEITDTNGCTSSASIEVEAGLVPVVEIEGVPEFCTGDSVMLTAQTVDGEGFTWSTGETTQSIWVNTAGEYCVMTASVDGCEAQACIEVEEAAIPEIYAGEDINICVEQSAVLTATGGTSGTTYTWYVDGEEVGTGETIVVSPGIGITEYQVVGVNDNCSISDEDLVKVYVYDYPLAGFERDPAGDVPYGEDVLFTDTTQGNVTDWHWDFGDGLTSMLQNPDHNYADPGSYWVTLIASNNGCEDTVTTGLEVKIIIDIPNVFTPNNDGMNDEIWIQGTDLDMISMTIYNRWGHSVFSGEGRQFSWSGKTMEGTDCEVGTYYYVIQMTYKDGNISEQTGFFTLLRNN